MLVLDQLSEGKRDRVARVAAGLTQYQLAQRANVSPPRLSDHERGVRPLPADAAARVRAVLADATESAMGGDDAAA